MKKTTPKTARTIAVDVLNQVDPAHDYAAAVLKKFLQKTDQTQRATDLTFGTIRNRQAIDLVITQLANRPVERIQPKMLNTIRVAVYELIYSPLTPEYAIVDEAVENISRISGKKQTGFVNAVLRQIERHIKNRHLPLLKASVSATLPQDLLNGCEFNTDILPDPKKSPSRYLSSAFSLPQWLTDQWLAEFGYETAKDICFATNRRPSVYLRVNTLKTTLTQLADTLTAAEIEFEILSDISMLKIKSPKAPNSLPGFDQGLFSVQDPTAATVFSQLSPQADWAILDLCAAPGSKTTQLAELTADNAQITATDINPLRLNLLKENINRLSLTSIKIIEYEKIQKSPQLFDAILVDAPCSNTGVLARRPEVRYRLSLKAVKKLTKIQFDLLDTAKTKLKPTGIMLYSTCSIQREENVSLVKTFLQKNPAFTLQSEVITLPSAQHPDHDGGYVATIMKKN